MPLCGEHHGVFGAEDEWGPSIFYFVFDWFGNQIQQTITGPFLCVWHPQGINDGTHLMEFMIY